MYAWVDFSDLSSLRESLAPLALFLALLAVVSFANQFRYRRYRKWRGRHWTEWSRRRTANRPLPQHDLSDPVCQMEIISHVEFEAQPLVNRSEFDVLVLLERVVQDVRGGFRVMAQTSLGEILQPVKIPGNRAWADLAYRAINSKRTDFVIVDRAGLAILAVEYQGRGHYQGNAVMRDAVKREAFRKARIPYMEVSADFDRDDLRENVRRILEGQLARRAQGIARSEPRPPRLQKRISG